MRVAGKGVTLDHDEYVIKKLQEEGSEGCNAAKVPMSKHHLADMMYDAEAGRWIENPEEITECQAKLGVLNWLALTTHPERSPYVSLLSKHNAKPVEPMPRALKHCYQYLERTIGNHLDTVDEAQSDFNTHCC